MKYYAIPSKGTRRLIGVGDYLYFQSPIMGEDEPYVAYARVKLVGEGGLQVVFIESSSWHKPRQVVLLPYEDINSGEVVIA